jgi:hypothetical protein
MKVTFAVSGLRPAYSKQANDFLRACDLGIEGAFVRDSVNVSGTVANSKTFVLADAEAKMHRVFETLGWRNVTICGTLRDA